MVRSWLPPSHDSHKTSDTRSCDILRGHSGPVYGLSFSRSGQHLLSASEDTTGIVIIIIIIDNYRVIGLSD